MFQIQYWILVGLVNDRDMALDYAGNASRDP